MRSRSDLGLILTLDVVDFVPWSMAPKLRLTGAIWAACFKNETKNETKTKRKTKRKRNKSKKKKGTGIGPKSNGMVQGDTEVETKINGEKRIRHDERKLLITHHPSHNLGKSRQALMMEGRQHFWVPGQKLHHNAT